MSTVPPHDSAAERAVLGAIMLSCQDAIETLALLDPSAFYEKRNGAIYSAMLTLYEANEPIDEITVAGKLESVGCLQSCGGRVYLAELTNMVPTAANVVHYAKRVRDKWLARQLIETTTEATKEAYAGERAVADLLDATAEAVVKLAGSRTTKDPQPIREFVAAEAKDFEQRRANKGKVLGVETGIKPLDKLISGLCAPDLLILAARPSMGKTALALEVGRHAAIRKQVPTLIFSLEMSGQQLTQRAIAGEGHIDAMRLRHAELDDGDVSRMTEAMNRVYEAPLLLDDSGSLTVLDIRAKARKAKLRHGLGLVIVDYLQLMHGFEESREREIAEISRGLKALAKELSIPVLALSQLNRGLEQRQDKRPMLSDLRESGAIEQDADVVMFVYRDEYYNPNSQDKGIAEVLVRKNRNGPTGDVKLKWMPQYTRFVEMSE